MPSPDAAATSLHNWTGQWVGLQSRLSALLHQPQAAPHFAGQLQGLMQEQQALLALDADSALYWLLQQASTSAAGYSALHGMTCAALCELVGAELGWPDDQRQSLVLAALSMNLAMTALQDELALQAGPPTAGQRESVETHAARGAQWLRELGVRDPLWLHAVEQHHDADCCDPPVRLLMAADRYAALISPRQSRLGRCVTDSGRHVAVHNQGRLDEVGHAFLRSVGICPPGTFVRLCDGRVALVLRRRPGRPGEPWVATLLQANGMPMTEVELVDTGNEGCGMEAALVSATVPVSLDHAHLLQLSRNLLAHA